MEKDLHKKIRSFERFAMAEDSKNKKVKSRKNVIEEMESYAPNILKYYTYIIEEALKKTNEVAVYHWRVDEDDKKDFLTCFFDLDFAKAYLKRYNILDVVALEIYLVDRNQSDKWESLFEKVSIHQDALKLFESIDIPLTNEKVNYFEDILPVEHSVNFGDELDCFMEDSDGFCNEELLLKRQEEFTL